MNGGSEATVESAALDWLGNIGWSTAYGPDIAAGGDAAERDDYAKAFLPHRLRSALERLNPDLPATAAEDAYRALARPEGATLEVRNRAFHRLLVEGVGVEYRTADGAVRGAQGQIIDFDNPANNDFLAVNQFTVVENKRQRRADVVLFVNGLPLVIVELKSATQEEATIWTAWQQMQTYKTELPGLFAMNAALVVSDGLTARIGTLTAGREWFKPWRTIEGEQLADSQLPELQVLLHGVCEPERLLALLRGFVVFEDDGSGRLAKKMAGYHQFHAVRKGIAETLRAKSIDVDARQVAEPRGRYETGRRSGGAPGDRRIGVVWHTQGAGKSLTMAFYAGAIVREPAMANPDHRRCSRIATTWTISFSAPSPAAKTSCVSRRCKRRTGRTCARNSPCSPAAWCSPPFRSSSRKARAAGATDIPVLSERRNIVVIADEAHRSQYDFIDGFARHMRDALPQASFVGFTGTPVEKSDANTRNVFGDYISIYDIQRAVEDQATVPIYYENRLAKLSLDEGERPRIDPDFDEATEGEEVARKEKLKTKWAQLEAVVGAESRLSLDRQGHRGALRAAHGSAGRQGHDRLHEPPHLHRSLPAVGEAASRTGITTMTTRAR